jgi:hypothetical protein
VSVHPHTFFSFHMIEVEAAFFFETF